MLQARIKKVLAGVELPKYHSSEAAGFDIAAGESVSIQPGEIKKIRTGLVIEAPEAHYLMIVARGSTASKKGLKMANAVGVVDRDFAGPNDEIFLPMHNFTDKEVLVEKGERVAQGIFVKVDQVEWMDMEEDIRDTNRGSYGSTGGYNI